MSWVYSKFLQPMYSCLGCSYSIFHKLLLCLGYTANFCNLCIHALGVATASSTSYSYVLGTQQISTTCLGCSYSIFHKLLLCLGYTANFYNLYIYVFLPWVYIATASSTSPSYVLGIQQISTTCLGCSYSSFHKLLLCLG